MKRSIAILLLMSMPLGIIGCGGNKEIAPSGGGPPVATQEEIQKQIEMSKKMGGRPPDKSAPAK